MLPNSDLCLDTQYAFNVHLVFSSVETLSLTSTLPPCFLRSAP